MTFTTIAQTVVEGKVISQDQESIPGANIYIEGTYDGASSNQEGFFSFVTHQTDSAVLLVSFIGYSDFECIIRLSGNPVYKEIQLSESASRLGTVVISAGSFEAGTSSKSEVLRPLDIVTTAGVTADVPGALNTLPGTQTVGEEGRLFVRGGDGYETTTFIDGVAVFDSYDLQGANTPTRSRFSPFMFSGTSFSTGGYSAEYGHGLSSALILNTKEVATETRTDVSLISVGLEAAHTHSFNESSLAAKVGYYNLDPYFNLISQDFDWIDPPTSYDGSLAFRQKVGKDGLFKIYGKFNIAGMTFIDHAFPTNGVGTETDLKNRYGHISTSYKDALSEKWMLRSGVSYTKSRDEIRLEGDQIDELLRGMHAKVTAGHEYSEKVYLSFGSEIFHRSHFQDFHEVQSGFQNRFEFNENIFSGFAEAKIFLSSSFVLKTGLRAEHNDLNQTTSFDPRISMALKTGEISQLSMAFGTFRQSAPQNLLRIQPGLQSEKATHAIINYQVMKDNRTFRIEAYWKSYRDLVTFDPAFPFVPKSYFNGGNGKARGLDFFYRDSRSFDNVDFWISYSFLDTERRYRDYPVGAAPPFTSKHNFSLVYKHFVPRLKSQFGLTYSLASGRPYSDPNTSGFLSERTPAYHDLSINLSYLPRSNIIIHGSVTNVLKRQNIFGYDFVNEPNEAGIFENQAISLPAPRFLFLGIFITLSKSGTVSQLPQL